MLKLIPHKTYQKTLIKGNTVYNYFIIINAKIQFIEHNIDLILSEKIKQ